MKKKGFTLIELLAVIVILAIIALIATPIVMNVIENARKSAAERSAENYLRAVDLAIASDRLDGPVEPGEYKIQSDGSLCIVENGIVDCSKSKLNVEVNGDKPLNGTILIQDGQIVDKLTETKPTGEQEEKFTIIITKENYKVGYNSEGKLEAVKNEDNEGSTEEPENTSITVYRWSTETMNLNQEIDPTDTTKFTTDPATLGKDLYLKHVVENNIVTESHACIVFDGEEVCVRGGSADYYGYAEDPANYTGNVLILNGLQDKVNGCGIYETDSMCWVNIGGYKDISATTDGSAGASETNYYCSVLGDGSSYCRYQ